VKLAFSLILLSLVSASAFEPPPKLAEQLLSNDSDVRLKAVDVFNKMPSDAKYKLVPDFMVALSSEDPAVRARATKILNILGVKPAEQATEAQKSLEKEKQELSASQKDGDRTKAFEEIQSGKSDGYDEMRKSLISEKEIVGFNDPTELRGQSGSAAAAYPLMEALKDPDPVMRTRAARRLGELRPAPVDAIPLLADMLTDKDRDLRLAAAGALGGFGPDARSAVPALMRALNDEDAGVRQIAGDALKQIQTAY